MTAEPRNPFYILLLAVSVAFVATVLAYAIVPWEQQPPWLQVNGWKLLLVEVGAIIVLGLLSMALDRWRFLRKPPASATIPPGSSGKV